MKIAAYPDILKYSNWQKHKGLVVKAMKKDTQLTNEIISCENRYKIAYGLATGHEDGTPLSPELNGALALFATECSALHDTAAAEAKKWSAKLCPVPKDTRVYAEKMAAAAKQFHDAILTVFKP